MMTLQIRSKFLSTISPLQTLKLSFSTTKPFSTSSTKAATSSPRPWEQRMSDEDFSLMSSICSSPSPVNFEHSLTNLLSDSIKKFAPDNWKFHTFKSHAGLVVETGGSGKEDDQEELKIMFLGHADKIRMQVTSIAEDGKIFLKSDSHLPLTLLGREVSIFTSAFDVATGDQKHSQIVGGTVEALGAIHFASDAIKGGKDGIKSDEIYIELGVHGSNKKKQVENLGIKSGDPILMAEILRRGVGKNTIVGPYLDNSVGCFVTHQLAKLHAEQIKNGSLGNVRCFYGFASHEEIGRFGSRSLVQILKPDILVAIDVNHDYVAAAGGKKFQNQSLFSKLEMGKGPTVSIGSVASPYLSELLVSLPASDPEKLNFEVQRDVIGVDTGTDAMAAVLSNLDVASLSVGVPIRNMHTVSEMCTTNDIYKAIHLLNSFTSRIGQMDKSKVFMKPNLNSAEKIYEVQDVVEDKPKDDEKSVS